MNENNETTAFYLEFGLACVILCNGDSPRWGGVRRAGESSLPCVKGGGIFKKNDAGIGCPTIQGEVPAERTEGAHDVVG